jgi:hypothetical protein
MKICRDDLRYTDDVIATLHSNNPTWYIAKALNISVDDVMFHYEETLGLAHNGTVLPITEETKHGYAKTAMLPRYAEYYETRTATQIANELNIDVVMVRNFVKRYGYKTKRAIQSPSYRNRWPSDPAWYAERTSQEIADALHVALGTVTHYARRHGFTWKRSHKYVNWPVDASYYASKKTDQIATDLNTSMEAVRYHCKKHGLAHIPFRKAIGWPADHKWYALRTRQQIADELGIAYNTARLHIWRMGITCRDSDAIDV